LKVFSPVSTFFFSFGGPLALGSFFYFVAGRVESIMLKNQVGRRDDNTSRFLHSHLVHSSFIVQSPFTPEVSLSNANMADLAYPLQSVSLKSDNPLLQTNKCKLNFLNTVRGEASLDISVGSTVNRNLFFLPPFMDVARVIVSPPIYVFEEGCTLWQSTIVGHFVGPKLPFPFVKSIANRFWGSLGLLEVLLSSYNNFFIFSFD
jgi:hypothetical protein